MMLTDEEPTSMHSLAKLYVSVKSNGVKYTHHIADMQCVARETRLEVVSGEDLKFDQAESCTLEKLYLEFHGLRLPVELRGAPFALSAGDSQRICDISISVDE